MSFDKFATERCCQVIKLGVIRSGLEVGVVYVWDVLSGKFRPKPFFFLVAKNSLVV